LPFECQTIAQNLPFFSKKLQKIVLFSAFFEKNYSFFAIFFEWQVFGNFLKLQFSGGSDVRKDWDN